MSISRRSLLRNLIVGSMAVPVMGAGAVLGKSAPLTDDMIMREALRLLKGNLIMPRLFDGCAYRMFVAKKELCFESLSREDIVAGPNFDEIDIEVDFSPGAS